MQAALRAPSLRWTRQAVAGKNMVRRGRGDQDEVHVARVDASVSAARQTRRRQAMSLVCSPSAAMRRSLMPVREVIHSSLVSTIFSRSALVITRSGA